MSFDASKRTSTFSNLMTVHSRPPQTKDNYHLGFMRSQQVSTDFVKRLGLYKELKGHQGCVNCLEWSTDGSLLASGSDDCTAIVWDPHRGRCLARIHTGHTGNIFSVNFLPHTGNGTLVSGAADSRVVVSDVARRQPVITYQCHSQRVKRLATARDSAFLFWSASEDGTVRQFDLRDRDAAVTAANGGQARNVLVDLHCLVQGSPEAKCLSVNPCRSETLAVGSNDHCVRLFDRRQLSLTRALVHSHRPSASSTEAGLTSETALNEGDAPDVGAYVKSAQYYIPGHLTREPKSRRHQQQVAVTYLTFSPDGRDLVANLGGEQVYTVPVFGRQQPVLQLLPAQLLHQQQQQNGHCCLTTPRGVPATLPPAAQALKSRANAELQRDRPASSVRLYTEALQLAPGSPVLLGNRAAALLKRRWAGDAYAAALDCEAALAAEPGYYKALYRLARAFVDLGWLIEAGQCVAAFRQRFPQHADAASFKELAAAATAADTAGGSSRGAGAPSAARLFRSHQEASQPLEAELQLRARALDLRQRFVGHCNTTTDIKEANFFGRDFLLAGSDEGNFFVWDRRTGALVRAIKGDESIVNCLQPHPTSCLLATSGIESVVRLWSPQPTEEEQQHQQHQPPSSADTSASADTASASDSNSTNSSASASAALEDTVARNQRLMRADPLELMLRSMGYRLVPAAAAAGARSARGEGDDEEEDSDNDDDAEDGAGGNAAAAAGDRGCRTS